MKKFFLNFKEKLKTSTNRELKALFLIGLFCLIQITFSILFNSTDNDSISTVIRSQLVFIFGYIFGLRAKVDCEYYDRNFQFYIAVFISIFCFFILITAYWIGVFVPASSLSAPIRSLSAIRDLMVSSIGFIIGQVAK